MPVATEDFGEPVVLSTSQMQSISRAKENAARQGSEGCPCQTHDSIRHREPLPIAFVAIHVKDLQHAVHFVLRDPAFSQMAMNGGDEFDSCVRC